MRLQVVEDYASLSSVAARHVADALRANPHASIAVPTGVTPTGFYDELALLQRHGAFDTTRLRIFQLDEYLGVAPDDPHSFAHWIARAFIGPLGIRAEQVTWLRGDAIDPNAVCRAYDAALRDVGGLDIAVLGLGENGHIGFNEPPADAAAPTRVVRLTDGTRAANAAYWDSAAAVPTHALTCGLANLLAARMKVLLVSGERKRETLQGVLHGPVSPELPASYLRRVEGVFVVADRAAAPLMGVADATSPHSG